jgi:class 3 adenylate cyclase
VSWTQRFAEPSLEAAYQRSSADSTQRQARVLTALALVGWIVMFTFDRETAGSDRNLRWLYVLRYAVGAPLGAAVLVLAWLPVRAFVNVRSLLAVAMVAAYVGTPLLMALTVPEPRAFDTYSLAPAILAGVVAVAGLYALWGVRFDVIALAIIAPIAVAWLLVVHRHPTPADAMTILGGLIATCAAVLVAWWIGGARREAFLATRQVEIEQARSQSLIENMLPASIAARLKDGPGRIAEHVPAVTVLFGDLVGFTPLAAELPPGEVVTTLDELFTELDEIAQRHGVEKIKTIGDAYMAVCGAPVPRADHAVAVAEMALEMRDTVAARVFAGGRRLELRIGIDTGPVVAGVIGKKKLSYDLWGDTVNTASRMESHGLPGKIHVTAAVHARLCDRYELTARGPQAIKGKGEMETWLLERRAR